MSTPESETFQPKEVEQKSDKSDVVDHPELEGSKVLQERIDLDKFDESRTKVKKFTMGDGGFGIDGLEKPELKAKAPPADGKGDAQQTQPSDARDEKKEKASDSDGGNETLFGSGVKRDDAGRPTEIEYPNGTTNKIKYDDKGEVKEMKTAEGKTVTRDGDHWNVVDAEGKKSEWKGDVNVTKEGDVIVRSDEGTTSIRHPDGAKTTINADGVSQETRDPEGRVTSITYPDGKTNKIEYDGDQIKAMKTAEGKTVTREGDHWKVTDRDGKTSQWKGDVQVTDEGDVITSPEGGGHTIRHADGSKTTINTDGVSQETRDPEGRVTSITYPDGKSNQIEYEGNEVKGLRTAEGNTVTREGDHWVITNPEGKKSEWKGTVDVTKDGDVVVLNPDGTGSVRRPDGSKETVGPN